MFLFIQLTFCLKKKLVCLNQHVKIINNAVFVVLSSLTKSSLSRKSQRNPFLSLLSYENLTEVTKSRPGKNNQSEYFTIVILNKKRIIETPQEGLLSSLLIVP